MERRDNTDQRPSKSLAWSLLLFCSLPFATHMARSQASGSSSPHRQSSDTVRQIYQYAAEHPADASALRAVEAVLPRAGDSFVVEGDLLMTESELQEYLTAMKGRVTQDKSRELLVAVRPNGALDYYDSPASRKLTYSIDRRTFPTVQQYEQVATSMQRASADWTSICSDCGVILAYDSSHDGSSSITTSNFVVRYLDVQGSYIAASFFPHDAPLRRYLNIDPSYFNSNGFDKIGVLRHELGHILGYRHEHIQGIEGCNYEDDAWKPLTPYDPHSVMHYFCGGGGSLALTLTDLDKLGHRRLYGRSSTPETSIDSSNPREEKAVTLIVRFEGGDVTSDAASVLTLLKNSGALPTATLALPKGGSLSEVYTSKLNLPGNNSQLNALAMDLNPSFSNPKTLRQDAEVIYPAVVFDTYRSYLTFDSKSPHDVARFANAMQNWKNLDPKIETVGGRKRLTHKGYELRVEMKPILANDLSKRINAQHSKNILATTKDASRVAQYFGHGDFEVQSQSALQPSNADQPSTQRQLRDLIRMPDPASCGVSSTQVGPRLILVDQPIFHHPLLEGKVDFFLGGVISSPVGAGASGNHIGSFRKDLDHGTHLAGIMVAKENSYGPVGINARASLSSWDWNSFRKDVSKFGDKLSEQADQKTPIFVFASAWDENDQHFLDKPMQALHALWIIAAGEELRPDKSPSDISSGTKLFPMVLGNLPYILEVTECVDCYSSSSRLDPAANFSDLRNGYVQVAAPGDKIVSTVGDGGYAIASGTSQATAVVAGLVSAMVSCWPSYFGGNAEKVKYWVQLTSWPGLRHTSKDATNDINKVAAGVVDGRSGILNPEMSWRLVYGQDNLDGKYVPFTPQSWCQDVITLYGADDDQPTETLDITRVRRIVRVGDEWYIYARPLKVGTDLRVDVIHRIGPGRRLGRDNSSPLLRTSDGDVSLADIQDVIFHERVRAGKCQ